MRKPIIVVGSDHAGYNLKQFVKAMLIKDGYRVIDEGPVVKESVDYPDFAEKVGRAVSGKAGRLGIISCGTGIGLSISANKMPGIRAALVHTPREAKLSREHNNANVLVIPGRPWQKKKTAQIVRTWLKTPFAKGRHLRRVKKINALEKI